MLGVDEPVARSEKSTTIFTISVTFLIFTTFTIFTFDLFITFWYSYFILFVLGIAGAALFCQNIRLNYKCSWLQCFWLFTMIGLTVLTVVVLVFLEPNYSIRKNMQNMVILTVIWAPAVEEAFFRLFLLNAFRKVSGRNLDALLGSSFFFMVIHITRYYADPLALTWMFLSSLFMGLLFIATRQLWPAIITHSLGNFVEHSITNTLDSSWGFYGWILLPFLPILIVIGIYTAIILLRNSDIPSARKFPEWLWKPVESTTYRSIAALLGLMIGFFTLLFFFPFSYGVTFYLLAWTGLPWFNPSPTVSLALPSITFIVIFTFGLVFVALLVNIVSTWKSSSNVKIESPLQG